MFAHCFHVRSATPSTLYEDFICCVMVRSPNAHVAHVKAQLVHRLLQAPMHTRALATLKMQTVKTCLQKSKHTTSLATFLLQMTPMVSFLHA
jgi:hypothetical protein